MSEAPKKIWVEQEFRDWAVDPLDYAQGTELTQYIRADIVEEMRVALLGLIADFVINGYTDDDIEKAQAALKRLEEE